MGQRGYRDLLAAAVSAPNGAVSGVKDDGEFGPVLAVQEFGPVLAVQAYAPVTCGLRSRDAPTLRVRASRYDARFFRSLRHQRFAAGPCELMFVAARGQVTALLAACGDPAALAITRWLAD